MTALMLSSADNKEYHDWQYMTFYDGQYVTSSPQAIVCDSQVLRFLEDLRSHPDISSVCGMIHKVLSRHHVSRPALACIDACVTFSFFPFFMCPMLCISNIRPCSVYMVVPYMHGLKLETQCIGHMRKKGGES